MQLGLRGWTLKCSAPPPPSAQGVKDVAQMLMGGRQVTVVNCVKEDDGPAHRLCRALCFVRTPGGLLAPIRQRSASRTV